MLKGFLPLIVSFAAAAAGEHAPSVKDLVRARMPRPPVNSRVVGATPVAAFENMNKVLSAGHVRTAPCETFVHSKLNDLARTLYVARAPELHDMYKARGDKRAFHFDALEYKEALWAAEEAAAKTLLTMAPGSESYNHTRDGKCAELVMWWIHHLSEGKRVLLAEMQNFVLPLMPQGIATDGVGGHEYALQISCTDCHVPVHIPGAPPIKPAPPRNGTGPQYPEHCDDVFYDRTKRCDWDYEPFCSPCEGVGGLIWGPGQHDWTPMPCQPMLKPEEIPKDNLTSPLWPKAFTVQEYADLSFPGTTPCKINFKNSTYTLYYDTRADGPLYHTVGHTGPSGPSPFPGKSWALGNGNFYNSVQIRGKDIFCICLSPKDPSTQNAISGPLRWNFLDTAKLIGRELIVPEYLKKPMVVDHWVKGPHHFWIEVATNLMVREWQPFNGHQIYYDWNLTKPDPSVIDVPEHCYKGLLHHNISCIAPPPSPPPAVLLV